MANKREYRRFIRRCETEFISGGQPHRGISSDFSLAGMFIRTKHPLPPDTPLDIKVYLPDGTTAELSGLVRRSAQPLTVSYSGTSQKSGMGVELTERDANYLEFLRSLLAEVQAQEDEAIEQAEAAASKAGPVPDERTTEEEAAQDRKGASMHDILVHLISTQQALLNLLDKEGVINKKDIPKEMAKLRRK